MKWNKTLAMGGMLAGALGSPHAVKPSVDNQVRQLSNSTNITSSPAMYPLSSDVQFAFYLAEILALANGGGASTGEILRAASQITPGDTESLYKEFNFLAENIHNRAISINATRSPTAARDTFFRAATYYRTPDFYLHGNTSDPRIHSLWDKQLADFKSGIKLLPIPGQNITIQGPGFSIPAYFYPANKPGSGKVPTFVAGHGDSSQEGMYHTMGVYALERGWNFVTYEGPGQPTVRRQQNLGYIPNWHDVVKPVLDYLVTQPDVDEDKIALFGLSYGGLLASRAASREHRVAALLTIGGLKSLQSAILSRFPDALINIFNTSNATAFDQAVLSAYEQPNTSSQFRLLVDEGLWTYNTRSPYEWMVSFSISHSVDK